MNWFKDKIAGFLIAMANVEKNSFSQEKNLLSDDISKHSEKETGTLMNSLKNNIVTQEVMNLRWRMYKILQESNGLTSEIIDYEPDGTPITKTTKKDNKRGLKKILLDKYDKYPLEMVINNDSISISGNDAMDNKYLNLLGNTILNYDDNGEVISATHGEISGDEYFATHKNEKPIVVTSKNTRTFKLEDYTKKINVRSISETEKLLEFYVSIYPDIDNRTSRLFLSNLKKTIINPKQSTIIDINEIGFITYKTIGVNDFLEYKYEVISFDKIIEFNGNYVIKFKVKTIINGIDILEIYKQDELEEKYKNKTKK
jgi:hypothetical protein